ncbi:hypothetical protein [Dyadobacter psychrotolerans]|uniref:Uncharacterized protein n=1 Tax=Dyadobacter psychrotolerans TaxID=2541721 RepID=A0A4R5DN25_9BACT|nr:hypothetical protein [Dyadobacter psychrotolerans]TDE12103.1 hypothetical protein E0F88_23960 [Dyadobacter psychrotolerans]
MKANKLIPSILFLVIFFESCYHEGKIDVSFALVKLSKMGNKKAIRVSIKNNSDKNVFILSTYLVNKVDSAHPCRNDILGEYSKISSHTGDDCTMNTGTLLFEYLQTIPFTRADHAGLKKTLSSGSGKDEFDFSTWFFYLIPGYHLTRPAPSFIFIEAKKTTYVYFTIDEELNDLDKGVYKLEWYSKERLQHVISPGQGKTSFKKTIEGETINGYEFYDGDFVVHPLQIRL